MRLKHASTCVFVPLMLCLSGCSQIYDFDGIVVDGDGQPLAGAKIQFYPSDWPRPYHLKENGTSVDDGQFEVSLGSAVGVEYFRMIVSLDGYREHDRLIVFDAKNLRIVLERTTAAVRSDTTTD